jgi:DNA polymerase IV
VKMKILCILLPHFPLKCELLRHQDLKESAVVTYAVGSQKLVLDYSPGLQGLQVHMPVQQALSLHNGIELIHADVPHYWSIFNQILDALEMKSPLIEGADLGTIYIGLDGLQLIYPDDDSLITAIKEVVPPAFEPRLGISNGKFMAYLAALYSNPNSYRTLTDDTKSFLENLPCDVLPVALKCKSKLVEFGLRNLGQLMAMKPGPLQSQFGPEGKKLWELANGRDDTPLYPRLTEEIIEESIMLSSVTVSLDVMLMSLESMLSRVFSKLEPRGMGIRSITLWTHSWVSEHWEKTIQFKDPVTNIKTTISRIKQVMENCSQPGPIEQLGMKITGLGRQWGRQKNLFPEVRAQDHLMNDIRQLESRLGSPQLYKIKEVEPWSRIPERRYAMMPLSQ